MGTRTKRRKTQRERSEQTRAGLVRSARELFAARGYADTSLDDVAEAAGVTKGAVYHHFDGKRALFAAVFEAEQQRLAEIIVTAYGDPRDPWSGFYAGCRAFLEASLDPGVQRITLLDAASVLGWETIRGIQSRYSLRLIKEGLQLAMAAGVIAPRPIDPLAHLMLGAMCESASLVARSRDQHETSRAVLAELGAVLDGLRR